MVQGRIAGLALILLFFSIVSIMILAKRWIPSIRKIAGLDMVGELIRRCTEMGRPAFFSSGEKGSYAIYTTHGSYMAASLAVLSHIAREAAQLGVPLTVIEAREEMISLADATMREQYMLAGKAEQYRPEEMMVFTPDQSYSIGAVSHIERAKPAAGFMVGEFVHEAIIIGGSAKHGGAMLLGCSTTTDGMAFLLAICDSVMLGEELFAAAAYLTKDPVPARSLAGQDICKLILLAMICLGVAFASAGLNYFTVLLKY